MRRTCRRIEDWKRVVVRSIGDGIVLEDAAAAAAAASTTSIEDAVFPAWTPVAASTKEVHATASVAAIPSPTGVEDDDGTAAENIVLEVAT
mmetsp:Transcript_16057/g.41240  ORF Transcript_16057/g.41240 Transcript_16057/m.41240 type:complete len:91 (-) Transcript_16057:344-616(-)